jgi:hypothetical protein
MPIKDLPLLFKLIFLRHFLLQKNENYPSLKG